MKGWKVGRQRLKRKERMMVFTVTYRGKDGARLEEAVEAAGRAECFAQMKARGITPVSVREGRSHGHRHLVPRGQDTQDNRDSQDRRRMPVLGVLGVPGVLAILVALALLAIGAWWWLAARKDARPPEPRAAKAVKAIRDVEVAKAPRPSKDLGVVKGRKPDAAPKPAEPVAKIVGPPPGTVLSVRTNDNNLVITEVVGPDGRKRLETTELRKPIFSNPSDQLIAAAMAASMGGGQMAPLPLGPESDWQFKAAMKKPILDEPDDTEEVKRMKQVVRETRQQIAELMEQGQSFADILTQHRELWNENVKIRDGVVAEYRKIVRSGNEEEARRYLNAMNAALGQMGIPPLTEDDGQSKRRRAGKAEVQDEH